MRPAGSWIVGLAIALFAVAAAGPMPVAHAQAQQEAVADGPIAEDEIEQRTRLWASVPGKPYTHEQVIAELRDEKRKIREAAQAGIEVMRSEVDAEYARMARRMDLTVTALTENLAEGGVGPETIKHRLHADIAWRRYQESRK